MNLDKSRIEKLSRVFKTFAERECKNVSNLYYQLSLEIAEEEELLKLAANCKARQPIPNLFYGAIHYLLLKSSSEELAKYYPSISKVENPGLPIELIKEFCKRREEEIIEILKSRIVQTNAINRTAYLMPIVSSRFSEDNPVNIVDIGTSSGLTMNFDLYEYNYNGNQEYGNSEVKIKSEILEGELPHFEKIIEIKRKIGIDQNPLDLRNENNATWLKALIWPDSYERFERMEAAIEVARASNIELHKANKSKEFREIIDRLPKTEELIIYHTHTLYQFNKGERKEFRDMLDEAGKERNYKYLAIEANVVFDRSDYIEKGIKIELTDYKEGKKQVEILGETNGHANWIKWK